MRANYDSSVFDAAKEVLQYEPETGLFYWLVQYSNRIRVGGVAGCVRKDGYIQIGVNKSRIFAHRLAWYFIHGELPDEIDHINHNRQDNRIENLRTACHAINKKNRTAQRNNTSGMSNVWFDKRDGVWVFTVKVDGVQHHLARSKSFDEVVAVRDPIMKKLGFHENHGKGEKPGPTPLRGPAAGWIHLHKRSNRYRVLKRIDKKPWEFGYFKTHEEAEARLQLIMEFAQAFR
jgi:hypothetical protein